MTLEKHTGKEAARAELARRTLPRGQTPLAAMLDGPVVVVTDGQRDGDGARSIRRRRKAAPPPRVRPTPRLDERLSGVLLHPTSLPGPHGIGDLGPEADRFVWFLAQANQRWWQMLPIGPVDTVGPYNSYSAFGGSPSLLSLERLRDDGLLGDADVRPMKGGRADRLAYGRAKAFRRPRLRKAFAAFGALPKRRRAAFEAFREAHRDWLEDLTLFAAVRAAEGGRPWWDWARPLRLRHATALRKARRELAGEMDYHAFLQYAFDRQWRALRARCAEHGVGLIGDIPIFVARDSCDVWAHRDLFDLDRDGKPIEVSGAAPDAFNRDGQRWGHPLYRWRRHKATGYAWWIERFRHTLDQFDAVRIDHFLGFARYWAIPAGSATARRGRWRRGPGAGFFDALHAAIKDPAIIAEDLGILTPQAEALRDRHGYPGMRVLQFAFGDEDGYHAPHNTPKRSVVYPGTHDNDTIQGWFSRRSRGGPRISDEDRRRALAYVGGSARTIHWDMIRAAMACPSDLTVFQAQDILGLGTEARMNVPGTITGNWVWRLTPGQLNNRLAKRLGALTRLTGRA